jgi:hypothetical protein
MNQEMAQQLAKAKTQETAKPSPEKSSPGSQRTSSGVKYTSAQLTVTTQEQADTLNAFAKAHATLQKKWTPERQITLEQGSRAVRALYNLPIGHEIQISESEFTKLSW